MVDLRPRSAWILQVVHPHYLNVADLGKTLEAHANVICSNFHVSPALFEMFIPLWRVFEPSQSFITTNHKEHLRRKCLKT